MVWKTFDFKGGRTRSGRKIGEILEGISLYAHYAPVKEYCPELKE